MGADRGTRLVAPLLLVCSNAGFDIDLEAKALLTIVYPGAGIIECVPLSLSSTASKRANKGLTPESPPSSSRRNGQAYSVDQVSEAPEVYVTPAQDTVAWFNSTSRYTLALADASSLGDPDSEGNYRCVSPFLLLASAMQERDCFGQTRD